MHVDSTPSGPRASLSALGWGPDFDADFDPHAAAGFAPARVTTEHRGAFLLASEDGELSGELAGRLRHHAVARAELPAVGDWVAIRARPNEGRATIHAVLPRRTKFSRKTAWLATEEQVVAANVDVVFVVSALVQELNVRRIERYLTMAWESGAAPVVVLNKSDLCDDVARRLHEVESVAFGVPIHVTSSVNGDGIEELRRYFGDNRTVALLGSSGVGKSTLLNRLAGSAVQTTADIRSDGRGRHTTTQRQLIRLPTGGLIVDTPGMRELQLWDAPEGLEQSFADIARWAAECRFRDCRHEREPACAVQQALADGALAPERLKSYRKLQRELEALERRQDKRALADERKRRRAAARGRRRPAW